MHDVARRNFILQQGFGDPAPSACAVQYSALHFQPRVVLIWVAVGIVLQSPVIFAALGAVLWWCALFPKLNPFDAVYNKAVASGPSRFRVSPAPPPRRTAQAMAGGFALSCALLTYLGPRVAAYVVEAVFLSAVLALTIGGFCLGSFVYHLVRGRVSFACQTLPWRGKTI
jgi:hypothetical protein